MSPQTAVFNLLVAIIVSPFLFDPSIAFCDFNEVTLGSSALFENRSLKEAHEKPRTQSPTDLLRPVAFLPHLSVGLALSKTGNDFVRLPSGISPREAWVKVLEVGPLHNFLEKGVSEPSWVGKVVNDTERELPRSQDDSLGIAEQLETNILNSL